MAETLKYGNGVWATKKGSSLAYNDESDNYKPLPFTADRDSIATRVNKDGLIEVVGRDRLRIDYTDSTKGVALLEPARSNLLLQSNQFDTTWALSVSIDLTSGQTGVGGSDNAWLLKRNGTGARHVQQSLSLSSAQYSYSVYLKAESTNWAYIWSWDNTASVSAYIDLENGVLGTTAGSNLDSTNIESVGNGWYRVTLTYTQATNLVRIYPAYSNGNVSTGTDNGIYIQYAQLEQGSYATSYIPTSGSSVTRVADTANGAGNSEVFNDSEGVLFADIAALANDGTARTITLGNNSSSNGVSIQYGGTQNTIVLYVNSGGASQSTFTETTNVLVFNKCLIQYKENDFTAWVNGFRVGVVDSVGSTFTSNTLDRVNFDVGYGSVYPFYGKTKRIGYYNTVLTDAELEKLTSYTSFDEMVTELNLTSR